MCAVMEQLDIEQLINGRSGPTSVGIGLTEALLGQHPLPSLQADKLYEDERKREAEAMKYWDEVKKQEQVSEEGSGGWSLWDSG